MRKCIIGIMAVAMLAIIPSVASADVTRCAATVTSTTTATFHLYNPKDQTGQWGDVWIHDFAITVAPTGSFTGSGTEHNADNTISVGVTVVGQIEADNKISFTVTQDGGGSSQTVTSALTDATSKDNGTISYSTSDPVVGWPVEARITAPVFSFVETTDLNHGQYVSAQGGGSVAAQKCAGMPIKSTQGTK